MGCFIPSQKAFVTVLVGTWKYKCLDDVNGFWNIYLVDISVLPSFRKRRIGTGLLDEICKMAIDDNYKNIWITVLKENKVAYNFFRNRGFKPVRTQRWYLKTIK